MIRSIINNHGIWKSPGRSVGFGLRSLLPVSWKFRRGYLEDFVDVYIGWGLFHLRQTIVVGKMI